MFPADVENFIGGVFVPAHSGDTFDNVNPHDGSVVGQVARSAAQDVEAAIESARKAYPGWRDTNVVARGDLVRAIAVRMQERKDEIAAIVATESGKILSHAMGETQAAIEMGFFVAGKGRP